MTKRTYNIIENMQKEELTQDPSLVQRPLRPTFSSFLDAKRAYENGNEEVRRCLIDECNIIYECYICRNLFRSLVNFISHKRTFCNRSATYYKSKYADNSSTVIIQPSDTQKEEKSNTATSESRTDVPTVNGSNKNINSVIDRLRRDKLTDKSKSTVLQLESVPNNRHAVYQTLKRGGADSKSIRTEVNEINNIINAKTVVDAEGKQITTRSDVKETTDIKDELKCNVCKIPFTTVTNLQAHIDKVHLAREYKCNHCPQNYSKYSAYLQHMLKDHKEQPHSAAIKKDNKITHSLKREPLQKSKPESNASVGESTAPKNKRQLVKFCNKKAQKLENSKLANEPPDKLDNILQSQEKPAVVCSTSVSNNKIDEANSESIIKTETETETDIESLNEMFANLVKKTFEPGLQTISLDNMELLESESTSGSTQVDIKEEVKSPIPDSDTVNQNSDAIDVVKTKIKIEAASPENTSNASHNDIPSIEVNNTVNEVQDLSVTSGMDKELHKEEKAEKPVAPVIDTIKPESTNQQVTRRKSRCSPDEKFVRCRCKLCHKEFSALSNLRRHISMYHYGANKFGCTLCNYRAFRRYDIVNHLGFVHKMTGDREAMAVEYVSVHEVHYTRDDVDGDILLLNDEIKKSCTESKEIKTNDKRNKRKSSASTTPEKPVPHIECKRKRKKLKRSHSQHTADFSESPSKSPQKRPMRNRVKPENKDFVYDMPSISKSYEQSTDRVPKRRHTVGNSEEDLTVQRPKLDKKHNNTKVKICYDTETLKGAAYRIAWSKTKAALAKAGTPPKLPAARPQIRPRLISTLYNQPQSVAIIDNTELELRRKTLLDDSYVRNFAEKCDDFRIRPCLEGDHSTVDTLLQKMDCTILNKAKQNLNDSFRLDANIQLSSPTAPVKKESPLENRIVDTLLQRIDPSIQQNSNKVVQNTNEPVKRNFIPQIAAHITQKKMGQLNSHEALLQKSVQQNIIHESMPKGFEKDDIPTTSSAALKSESVEEKRRSDIFLPKTESSSRPNKMKLSTNDFTKQLYNVNNNCPDTSSKALSKAAEWQRKYDKMSLKMDALVPPTTSRSNQSSKHSSRREYNVHVGHGSSSSSSKRVNSVDRISTLPLINANGERIFDSGIVLPKSTNSSPMSKKGVTIFEKITDKKSKHRDSWLRTVLDE
ncbi:zinc finger protein 800 isoform X2 [Teleopsis dalmanni]|uniref:zinc finger protein 800 isoform X2 n=1 Tax=Teleopsis dalmanni TaxID=139649 RepID=UPI0018CF4AD9|nr:zinc finger protein 800 isoform X2 [Teleopsis dalmanni]